MMDVLLRALIVVAAVTCLHDVRGQASVMGGEVVISGSHWVADARVRLLSKPFRRQELARKVHEPLKEIGYSPGGETDD